MRNNIIMIFSTLIILSCNAQTDQENKKTGKSDLKLESMTPEQKASYSYGFLVADNLKKGGMTDLDATVIATAIKDVMEGKTTIMDISEAQTTWQAHAEAAQKKQAEVDQQASIGNKDLGTKFLAENAKKAGVTVLPNGLQYEIVRKGTGALPKLSDKVEVHYHGMLIDGTVFDSSVDRGQPATFGLTQVIKGWTEILQLMPEGSKWRVYIPEDLAYGANPRPGGPIKPYMTLIFDIDLIKIVK